MTAAPIPPSVLAAIESTPRRISFPTSDTDPDSVARSTASVIFAALARMTAPIIEAYHGDLFNDAMQLYEALCRWDGTTHLQLHFSFDSCGTTMTPLGHDPPGLLRRKYAVMLTIYGAPDRYGNHTAYMAIKDATAR